jgi:hypothetical protein
MACFKYNYYRQLFEFLRKVKEVILDLSVITGINLSTNGLKKGLRTVTFVYILLYLVAELNIICNKKYPFEAKVIIVWYDIFAYLTAALCSLMYVLLVYLVNIGFGNIIGALQLVIQRRKTNLLVIRAKIVDPRHLLDKLMNQHLKLNLVHEEINETFGLFLLTAIISWVSFITVEIHLMYRMIELQTESMLQPSFFYRSILIILANILNTCSVLKVNEAANYQVLIPN